MLSKTLRFGSLTNSGMCGYWAAEAGTVKLKRRREGGCSQSPLAAKHALNSELEEWSLLVHYSLTAQEPCCMLLHDLRF